MGRKVDLLVLIRKKINRLRKMEYFIEKNNLDEESMDCVEDFLVNVLSTNLFDLIEIDLKESQAIEDWPFNKLKSLAQKLSIKYWATMTRGDLIFQIKNHEVALQLYFPSSVYEENENGGIGASPYASTRKRKRDRNKTRFEKIRDKISGPFEHGSSFGKI